MSDEAERWERIVQSLDTVLVMVDRLRGESAAWQETAAEQNRNASYYCGLLDQIAATLGPDAFVSDDGSVQDAPIRAKVPDLVGRLKMERDDAVVALAESDQGRTDQLRIIVGLRERLEDMETLICAAAPLAWAHGVNVDHAHEWEKQAKALVEAAMKANGR